MKRSKIIKDFLLKVNNKKRENEESKRKLYTQIHVVIKFLVERNKIDVANKLVGMAVDVATNNDCVLRNQLMCRVRFYERPKKDFIEKEIIDLKELAKKWLVTANRFDSIGAESHVERHHASVLEKEIVELEKYLKENYDS